MSLPTPAQLEELSGLIVEHGKLIKGKWYTFKGMLQTLERARGDIASKAVGSVAKSAVNSMASAAGVTTAGISTSAGFVAFVPVATVLAPWIAAADIVRQAGDIFELHQLKDHALQSGRSGVRYYCICGKCFENIKYVVDKKERNVGRVAIGVATLGVSAVFTTINSIVKSFQSGRPKEMVSKGLVESARGGCTVAMAAIFLLSGNWEFLRGGNAGTMRRAIAIMTSEDGWQVLKSSW
ncbi:MAG: hypothetical protein IRZ13_03090 [Acetobacteraceae bacterium]|nr:hypothetical protein [Acetobacteraceae bacterium]